MKQEKRLTQKQKQEKFLTVQNYLRTKAEIRRKKEARALNRSFERYDTEEY